MNVNVVAVDYFGKLLSAIAPLIAGWLVHRAAASQRGDYAKQIHTIDLATKRIDYWDKYLKLSELANGAKSVTHNQVEAEVNAALIRIRDEADKEMKRLSWRDQITRSFRKEDHNLEQTEAPTCETKKQAGRNKRKVGLRKSVALGFFLVGMVMYLIFLYEMLLAKNDNQPHEWFWGGGALVFVILGRMLQRYAQEAKYPKPLPPLIDRV